MRESPLQTAVGAAEVTDESCQRGMTFVVWFNHGTTVGIALEIACTTEQRPEMYGECFQLLHIYM